MNRPDAAVGALWPSLVPLAAADDDAVCVVAAHGHRLRFADGREVLDGTSGLWNVNLGYGNPEVTRRVAEALAAASYAGVFRYENGWARAAARRLLDLTDDRYDRVLFSVSGGTANDLTMKLARHHHALGGEPDRKLVIGLRGSYHGLTFGAHALSGDSLAQREYGVDTRLVRHVAPNDLDEVSALFAAVGRQVAAIVVEPVLGSGCVVLRPDYLAGVARLAAEHGALLVADEVATGFGRTGEYFASQAWPHAPDVLIVSKGLTNGTMPASAVLVSGAVTRRFHDAGALLVHAETQAGSPVTCAAALATMDEMDRLDAVRLGRGVGERLAQRLDELMAAVPQVLSHTGAGCFRAVCLADPDGAGPLAPGRVPQVVRAVREAGATVHPGPGGVQLVPALTYSADDVDELVGALATGLERLGTRAAWAATPAGSPR